MHLVSIENPSYSMVIPLMRHQIEDYEPKHSLVVTPIKMVKFYEDVWLAKEIYPWSSRITPIQTAM